MKTHILFRIFSLTSLITGAQFVFGAAHDKIVQETSQLCMRQERTKHLSQTAYLSGTNELVTVSGENEVLYWDARTAEYKGALPCGTLSNGPHPLNPTHITTSPGNNYIAFSPDSGAIRIFFSNVYQGYPEQQKPVQSIENDCGSNNELTFSSDSRYLISASPHTSKQALFIHNIRNNATKRIKDDFFTSCCLAAHPTEGSHFASSSGGFVRLYTVKGKKVAAMSKNHCTIAALKYSPDGRDLASSSYRDSEIQIWDGQTCQPKEVLKSSDGTIPRIAYSPDGRQLAFSTFTETGKGIIRLYDLRAQQISHTLDGNQNGIMSLLYTSDANLVSAARNGTICIWDSRIIAALTALVDDESQKNTNVKQIKPEKPETGSVDYSYPGMIKRLKRVTEYLEV